MRGRLWDKVNLTDSWFKNTGDLKGRGVQGGIGPHHEYGLASCLQGGANKHVLEPNPTRILYMNKKPLPSRVASRRMPH